MKHLAHVLSAVCLMLVSLTAAADSGVLESYNQAMFKFNDSVDQAAVKPIAKAYKAVVPSPLRTGVNNFFNNLRDAWTAVNQFLQGKPDEGLSDAGRFAINSTFGIFGLFDVASADDIPKHTEDFGQTLGYWGVGEGSYFVIPLLGPSTVRDTAALFADWEADPVGYLDDVSARNSLYALRAVDDRRAALNATNTIDEMAIDRYQAYKNAWLAHRRYDVTDGAYIAPDDPEQEEETE